MNRTEALRALESSHISERLQAARLLSRVATPTEVDPLKAAFRKEDVYWVKVALERALDRAASRIRTIDSTRATTRSVLPLENEPYEEIFAQAVEETTGRLVHEISPILGAAALYAEMEVPDYENSKTKRELARLEALVQAIETLGAAAAAPKLREFNLPDLIAEICDREVGRRKDLNVELAGPTILMVIGDESLIEVVLRNGLKNALEASRSSSGPLMSPVVVTWDRTDQENWVAILDRGHGLPQSIDRLFEIGSSNKEGHLGMGLALAHQAAVSLRGRVDLEPRPEGGTRFRFSWPRSAASGT